jgi:hypothetical protein
MSRGKFAIGLVALCGLIVLVLLSTGARAVVRDGCCDNQNGLAKGCPECADEPGPNDFCCTQNSPYRPGSCAGNQSANTCSAQDIQCVDAFECIYGAWVGGCFKPGSETEYITFHGCYDVC